MNQDLDMCSVLFCVWDLKRWIDGWSKLKGAVVATVKGRESRSANLWIRIRTWICAMCVCVFEDLKSLCKDRIEREASQAYPKRASLPCLALRCALLLPAVAKLFLLRRCRLDRQIFCSIRYVSFHILVLSVCHKR